VAQPLNKYPSVLIVSGDPALRAWLASFLFNWFHRVVFVDSIALAVRELSAPPATDLVLTSYWLGDNDAVDLHQHFPPHHADTPIVVFTAYSMENKLETHLRTADMSLLMPSCSETDLIKAIEGRIRNPSSRAA
jgi:DNA-binding NtrC family response regulator